MWKKKTTDLKKKSPNLKNKLETEEELTLEKEGGNS